MDTSKENIAILILAAGASSRMGRPKQLLPWGNTTLLGHSIRIANAARKGQVTVVLGANADFIKSNISMAEVNCAINPNWKSGLGSSLAFGIEYLTKMEDGYDGILIMLCDQPLMDAKFLNRLIDQFKSGKKGIIATQYAERAGVPAIFHSKYFSELTGLNKDFGAKSLLDQHKNDVLELDPLGRAADVDIFEEYQRLVRENL